MGKTIYKYPIKEQRITELQMPAGAKILSVQTQFNVPVMWALVDPDAERESRTFQLIGTGGIMLEDSKHREYIGTFQLDEGNLVFHLFELKANA